VVDVGLLERLEASVVHLYYKVDARGVNELRKFFIVGDNRYLFTIPPTAAALHQHVLRAAYQTGVVWGRCLKGSDVLSPLSWGWDQDGAYVPTWTTLPPIWNEARRRDKLRLSKPYEQFGFIVGCEENSSQYKQILFAI
jgi:hypothetical protein